MVLRITAVAVCGSPARCAMEARARESLIHPDRPTRLMLRPGARSMRCTAAEDAATAAAALPGAALPAEAVTTAAGSKARAGPGPPVAASTAATQPHCSTCRLPDELTLLPLLLGAPPFRPETSHCFPPSEQTWEATGWKGARAPRQSSSLPEAHLSF